MKAASFKRCVQYVTGKEDAKILASDGVLLMSTQDIIDSFEFQRQLNLQTRRPYRSELSAKGQGQTDRRDDGPDSNGIYGTDGHQGHSVYPCPPL